MSDYSKLLEPIKIGNHVWKNRIVKGPSSTLFWGPNQYCNDTVIDTFEAIAKGGAAAVILGACISDDPRMLLEENNGGAFEIDTYPFGGLYDDKFIPGMAKLADAIHSHGCEIIAQIFQNGPALETKGGAWAASTVEEKDLPSPPPYCFPTRGVSLEEIEEFKERYVAAAERAKKAGLDGVEVHAANGYFILSFVSRVWNHRDDQYGCQSIENRTRLACELIRAIKERCGEDFIVGVRTNGQEFEHPDATTPEEGVEIAKYLDAAGADYISVTGYGYGPCPFQYAADYWMYPEPEADMKQFMHRLDEDGLMIPPAASIKQNVKAPVFGIGSLTVDKAARIIGEGKVDIGLFARALWADPEIAHKLEEGRAEDIRQCNHCGTCDDEGSGEKKRCRVNPAFGREKELEILPAQQKKNVLIVGGGAAGLEAGRVAAQRGHNVTLCEKDSVLALKLSLATMVKGTVSEDVPALISWLTTQAQKQQGLTIKMKTEVTPDLVKKMKPDVIIVATGGTYGVPNIPGINLGIVSTVPQLSKLAATPLKMLGPSAVSKLSQIALPGVGKNCVVLGGQIEAIQGAIFLSKRGKNVTILEDSNDLALRIPARYKERSLRWIEQHGIQIIRGIEYDEIDKKGIFYFEDGAKKRLSADTIMVFKSPDANHSLYESLKDSAPEVYAIGACNGAETSLMVDALSQGREVAVKI